ncbi:MAG: YncE family protein [Acidobacteriota bacterium]|nr:YncE family protein [Acidobacteriota bacterium]
MKSFIALACATAAFAAPPAYKVITKIKVGGAGRWDYVYVDSNNHRLYVAHSGDNAVEVIDTSSDKVVGRIADTTGVHGIAVANDLGKGYTSNGGGNNVTIFDLKTNAPLGKVNTGQNPDSIIYEPTTHRVFTFNGRSKDATVIDAKTNQAVAASVALGGKPEFSQVDGKGHVFANLEDKNEIVVLNASDATVAKHYSIAPCDSPSGLAYDPQKGLLYSVCDGKTMVISNPTTGKVVGTAEIGEGVDGVAFDDGYAFSANGKDGTITMVGEVGGKWAPAATIRTQNGARTIGSDQKAHKLYLPAAEYGPAPQAKDGKAGRPQALPDSFEILVVGR